MKYSKLNHTLWFILVCNTIALAEGAEHHAETIYDIRFFYVHFLIFAGLMYYLLKKPVVRGWHSWIENIESSVEKGTKALEAAQEKLQEAEGRLATLPQTISEMNSRIKHESVTEAEEIISEAKNKLTEIKKRGVESIQAETIASEKMFQQTLAYAALSKARALLEGRVKPQNDKKRREEALSGIGRFGALQ